ncbi:MAG: hypothetical protein ACRCXL_12710 [Dermatophilaceae bacterium]
MPPDDARLAVFAAGEDGEVGAADAGQHDVDLDVEMADLSRPTLDEFELAETVQSEGLNVVVSLLEKKQTASLGARVGLSDPDRPECSNQERNFVTVINCSN